MEKRNDSVTFFEKVKVLFKVLLADFHSQHHQNKLDNIVVIRLFCHCASLGLCLQTLQTLSGYLPFFFQ